MYTHTSSPSLQFEGDRNECRCNGGVCCVYRCCSPGDVFDDISGDGGCSVSC